MEQHHVNESGNRGETPRENRGKIVAGILGGLLIIAIILAIVLPRTLNGARNRGNDTVVTETPVDERQGMEPITAGEFTYRFDGIEWKFQTTEQGSARVPETQVAFFFDNFSRRDGVPVEFNNPYRLGLYAGTCEDVTSVDDLDEQDGKPLAFARCTWENQISEVALFQDRQEIIAKNRRFESEGKVPAFGEIYTLDMATIVR